VRRNGLHRRAQFPTDTDGFIDWKSWEN